MIRLTIETGNAAFEGEGKALDARIIEDAADKIEGGRLDFKLVDVNGNTIGRVAETEDAFEPEAGSNYVVAEIETGNAAFEDDVGHEVARILRDAVGKIGSGNLDFKLRDVNGNTVGSVGEVVGPAMRQDREPVDPTEMPGDKARWAATCAMMLAPVDMDALGALRHVYKYVGTLVDGNRPSKAAADWEKVGSYSDGVIADKVAADLCDQGYFSAILSVGEYSPELRYVLNHFSPSEEVYFAAHPSERKEKEPVQSLYTALKVAGIEVGNHESDLYVPVTPESTAILAKYPTSKANATVFKSNINGKPNYEVPFAYEPYWVEKSLPFAQRIASEKAWYEQADASVDKAYSGKVMGVTDCHVVLSLGRTALIVAKSDLDRVPAKDEEVSVTFKDGKGTVQPSKERGGIER